MAIYLDEDQFGSDANCIGFPHVLLCMAVVAMTGTVLYGVHLGWPGTTADADVAALDGLITTNGDRANLVALYGSCNRTVRYPAAASTRTAWETEMAHIAGLLHFNGTAYGFDTAVIAPRDGTYIEYQPDYPHHQCSVYYKRNEKMAYTMGAPTGAVTGVSHYTGAAVAPPVETTRAAIVRTYWNKGRLHEVNYATRMNTVAV